MPSLDLLQQVIIQIILLSLTLKVILTKDGISTVSQIKKEKRSSSLLAAVATQVPVR